MQNPTAGTSAKPSAMIPKGGSHTVHGAFGARLPCSGAKGLALDQACGNARPQRCTCSHTREMTTDPSPTALATRLTDPARTSPTAKIPGCEVA